MILLLLDETHLKAACDKAQYTDTGVRHLVQLKSVAASSTTINHYQDFYFRN